MKNTQQTSAKSKLNQYSGAINYIIFVAIIILVYVISNVFYKRFDLTEEKRYSISNITKNYLKNLDDIVYVKVFISPKESGLPSGLKELAKSTKDILQEFKAYGGSNVEFEFIDINKDYKDEATRKKVKEQLYESGMQPIPLTVVEDGEQTQKIIFPWAMVTYKGRDIPVQLLEMQINYDQFQNINNSVILLEYKLANTIQKLQRNNPPIIAFAKGHGELPRTKTEYIYNALQDEAFHIFEFDLTQTNNLIDKRVDVLVIAKPTQPFTRNEKFIIDQFVMQGGKVLWLVDGVNADMDSLNNTDFFLSMPLELNLDDILFKYGVRVNNTLIQDAQMHEEIALVTSQVDGVPQTQSFPWLYYPTLLPTTHSITKNLDPVFTKFTSTLDTIRVPNIKKTVLLTSSQYSKALLAPIRVHLGIINQTPPAHTFTQPNLPAAVLLEGKFTSLFKNQLNKANINSFDSAGIYQTLKESEPTKMIVVADGDVISNDLSQGKPLPLGYSKFTRKNYANATFITNCLEYLIDNNNLIETRNKDIKLRQLDAEKVRTEKTKWQFINIGLPLILLLIFGVSFNAIRKKRNT